jgi:uncharacterized protein with FMN-binding domain
MNSTRCFRLFAVALAVVGLVGTASAVTVAPQDVPEEAEIGEPADASFTMTGLYEDIDAREWTLVAETELEDPTWNISYYDQTGDLIGSQTPDGESVQAPGVSADDGVSEVRVIVTGTVPSVEDDEYSYPEQDTFVAAQFARQVGDRAPSRLDAFEVVHYTEQSREARQALDDAREAIDAAESEDADVSGAQSTFENARSVYRSGEFDEASSLAADAQSAAESAQEDAQAASQTNQLLLYGVGAVVLLLVVGGGVYYYRQSQQQETRLR